MTDGRQVAVLGLGRFGQTVARELARLGHDVLALDMNERLVQEVADDVTHAVQTDFTDEEALSALGLGKYDTAIVAVSTNLESSILTTVLLQRLGVRRIVAKAANELHGSILQRLGVSRVVYPEREIGLRVAHSFSAPGVSDYLNVAPGYGFARVSVPQALVGKPLATLDLQNAFGITPVALHRGGGVTLNPAASEVLRQADELVIAGLDENLERLRASVTPPDMP
jgi:trk system potassium uptake protein TrkA